MNSMRKMAMGLACSAMLAGCSHGVQIEEHALDYNRTVENSENAMLLLNIVRAAKRRPMHFTRISALQSTLSSSAGLGPELPFGSDSTENYAKGLSLSVASSPTVTYAVLNSKEFFNGILTPVSDQTFDLFRSQGWDLNLLMHLLVERVELFEATEENGKPKRGQPICIVENEPRTIEPLRAFEAIVQFASKNVQRGQPVAGTAFGPKLDGGKIDNAKALALLKETGLSLVTLKDEDTGNATGKYQLNTPSAKRRYKIRDFKVQSAAVERVRDDVGSSSGQLGRPCNADEIGKLVDNVIYNTKSPARGEVLVEADVFLRSVQAMMYYLGELSRVDLGTAKPGEIEAGVQELGANNLWNVSIANDTTGAVTVQHGSSWYSIGEDQYDTLQMLTLIRQLYAINVAASKAPAGPTILQVVGN